MRRRRRTRADVIRGIAAAAARLQRRADGPIDVAVVLGSGLGDAIRSRFETREVPYAKLGAPLPDVPGHPGVAHVGMWLGKRVVAFAGRAHLYSGHSADAVTYLVRLAAAAGATTVILTNAAGGLSPALAPGDLMLVSDHLNLTGTSVTYAAGEPGQTPFIDMLDAYSHRLRTSAHERYGSAGLHEGVYAGVLGPQYETAAEAEALRRLGADAVGMSTVLETIAARRCGLEVLAISLITNAIGSSVSATHDDVLRVARDGAERTLDVVAGVIPTL